MMPVNPRSLLCKHAQVCVWILRHVADGRWKPGHRIPKQPELEKLLHTTNVTVQHARRKLIAAGVLRGGSGRRTTVRPGGPTIAKRMLDELHQRLTGA